MPDGDVTRVRLLDFARKVVRWISLGEADQMMLEQEERGVRLTREKAWGEFYRRDAEKEAQGKQRSVATDEDDHHDDWAEFVDRLEPK